MVEARTRSADTVCCGTAYFQQEWKVYGYKHGGRKVQVDGYYFSLQFQVASHDMSLADFPSLTFILSPPSIPHITSRHRPLLCQVEVVESLYHKFLSDIRQSKDFAQLLVLHEE